MDDYSSFWTFVTRWHVHRYEEEMNKGDALLHVRSENGNTLLHNICCHGGSVECAKVLVFNSSNNYINTQNNIGNTPLHIACENARVRMEIIELLINTGADITIKNNKGHTPLDVIQKEDERYISIVQNIYDCMNFPIKEPQI